MTGRTPFRPSRRAPRASGLVVHTLTRLRRTQQRGRTIYAKSERPAAMATKPHRLARPVPAPALGRLGMRPRTRGRR
jgi:hypothetical protein